ncbi:DUF7282 domain-containing protein [Klenkia brasiliensis]|uniref:DUF7282 domain-containing protein n=1 Tax=Klenkia brasiliensis TaxID=333142 RepID=A0A1G7M160_9ACTN|nr:hypothetical protein [Klenkia brasiliensis]SDF55558.1 hypothetical protein SAMN05660324_0466 [Klenkia brasiliensis]
MTARRLLLALPAATALAVLPACGSDDDAPGTAATPGPTTGGASSSAPAAVGGGTTAAADVELEDQSGDGTTVQVASVTALEDGFVVITLDEDDGGQVLGWAAVPAGPATGVPVDLGTPVPATAGDDDTGITATLHADTDGDGSFSAGDAAVAEPQDGDDDDGDDVVDDDAEYRVA